MYRTRFSKSMQRARDQSQLGHPNKSMGGQRITLNVTDFWRSSVRRVRLRYEDLDDLSAVAGWVKAGHRIGRGQVQVGGRRGRGRESR